MPTIVGRRMKWIAVGAMLAAACAERPVPPVNREKWAADSAAYERAVAVYERDSAVIDSIATQVPTDSIVRLYRALSTSRNPASVESALFCEITRLAFVYGSLPANMALERVRHLAPPDRPGPSRVLTMGDNCVLPRRPIERVGSTSLRFYSERPVPPRRPRGL